MNLEQSLRDAIEKFGPINWQRMFGRNAALVDGKLFCAYKLIDDNVIDLFARFNEKDFQEALSNGFVKFVFGNTWAQIEISSESELNQIQNQLEKSYRFVLSESK